MSVPWIPSSVLWTESFDQVLASNADIVVELAGGLNPAGDWVRLSLAAGKSVVTANKQLIARHGPDLLQLATLPLVVLAYLDAFEKRSVRSGLWLGLAGAAALGR